MDCKISCDEKAIRWAHEQWCMGRSVPEIAAALGVCDCTIRRNFKKRGMRHVWHVPDPPDNAYEMSISTRALSDEGRAWAREMYSMGLSRSSIAKKLFVSEITIWRLTKDVKRLRKGLVYKAND